MAPPAPENVAVGAEAVRVRTIANSPLEQNVQSLPQLADLPDKIHILQASIESSLSRMAGRKLGRKNKVPRRFGQELKLFWDGARKCSDYINS